MITQTELEELIREHGLAPYVYIKNKKEQFKLNLLSSAQYVTWRDNPQERALLTIAKNTNPKRIIKKLNHAKRMIDQERLRLYDGLTDLYKLTLKQKRVKERYQKLLNILRQVRHGNKTNPWFLLFAQRQIYSMINDLDITNAEAHILKNISGYRYREELMDSMNDPLLMHNQRILEKIEVDSSKLNQFIRFIEDEIAEIERYVK